MRLRKFTAGKRIGSVVYQFCQRKLWLLAGAGYGLSHAEQEQHATWLCLDLVKGPQLHFCDPHESPSEDKPSWPGEANLEDALVNWQNWPVLTPALRKTLLKLPHAEQLALLCDLESGGGDAFIYSDSEQNLKAISAWPLPADLRGGLVETARADIIETVSQAGAALILTPFFEKSLHDLAEPGLRRQRQLNKILDKLREDEARLLKMRSREDDGLLIKANLWHLAADNHLDMLDLPDCSTLPHVEQEQQDGTRTGKRICLDRRFSVLENMERFFKQAARGKRGLEMLAKRRAEVLQELENLKNRHVQAEPDACSTCDASYLGMAVSSLPKHVQGFISSDNYLLLRGKDAEGNRAIRRMAKPHDLWVHVKAGQGSHVVIRNPNPAREIPAATLDEAGVLAANKSWLFQSDKAEVMYAQIRHVKPIKGAVTGNVSIDRLAMTRIVRPDPELDKKLIRK